MTTGKHCSSPARPLLRICRSVASTLPAAWDGQTVREQLRCRRGPQSATADLAGQLDCSAEDAARLLDFWLPDGPPFLRDQALAVFARALDLQPERLRGLFTQDDSAPTEAPLPEPTGLLIGRPLAAPHIPTIVWRKRRLAATPA